MALGLSRATRDRIDRNFLSHLVKTQGGRAHVLSQVADAESSGESRIFEQLLSKVDDAELAKLIRRHQQDELRHAALFLACEARNGLPPREVPASLKVVDRLDASLGGPLQRPITTREGVMEAYLLLQVIEERAIAQFTKFIAAFEPVDPQTAAVFREVALDEERHLKYCHAISRKYAPDEATLTRTLEKLRRAEAQAYQASQLENLRVTLSEKLMPGAWRRAMWRVLGFVGRLASALAPLPARRESTEFEGVSIAA